MGINEQTGAENLAIIIQMLGHLWKTQLGGRDDIESTSTTDKDESSTRPCLPVIFTNEILQLLLLLPTCARTTLPDISCYMSCLVSVLNHLSKTGSYISCEGGGSVEAVTVSLQHVCALLTHYAKTKQDPLLADKVLRLHDLSCPGLRIAAFKEKSTHRKEASTLPNTQANQLETSSSCDESELACLLEVICNWSGHVTADGHDVTQSSVVVSV